MVHGVPCFNTRNMPDDVIAVLRRIAPAPIANVAAPIHASDVHAPPLSAPAAVVAPGSAPTPAIQYSRRPKLAAAAADLAVGDLDSLSAPSDVVPAWMRRASPEKSRPTRATAPATVASWPDISAVEPGVASLTSILERWIAPAAERLLRRELGEVCLASAPGRYAFASCSPDMWILLYWRSTYRTLTTWWRARCRGLPMTCWRWCTSTGWLRFGTYCPVPPRMT